MKKTLYVAYGSNLNIIQMIHRCSDAELYCTGVIHGYELQFKGRPRNAYATIAPCENSSVPVAVWKISKRDEERLDLYEGYPSHYYKDNVTVSVGDKEIEAMVYVMNPRMNFGMPSDDYLETVYNGYKDCNLDVNMLVKSVSNSAAKYYASVVRDYEQAFYFDQYEANDEQNECEQKPLDDMKF